MDGRRNNKGTPGNRGGRTPKSEEQRLIEKLSPLEEVAHKKLKQAVDAGEQWAVKLFFEYMYGKPKQSVNVGGEGMKLVMEFADAGSQG